MLKSGIKGGTQTAFAPQIQGRLQVIEILNKVIRPHGRRGAFNLQISGVDGRLLPLIEDPEFDQAIRQLFD